MRAPTLIFVCCGRPTLGECKDQEQTEIDYNGNPASCSYLQHAGHCDHAEHGLQIKAKCRKSCNQCQGKAPIPCQAVSPPVLNFLRGDETKERVQPDRGVPTGSALELSSPYFVWEPDHNDPTP